MTEQLAPRITADEAIQRIAADIQAYPRRPSKLEEHLRLYSEVLDPEEIRALWTERYAATEWPLRRRKLPDDPAPSAARLATIEKLKEISAASPAPAVEPREGAEGEGEEGTELVVADPRALNQLELPNVGTGLETVHTLNLKHAVIGNYGGKCLVLSWERWAVNEGVLAPTYQKFEDFKHRYMNSFVQVEGFNRVQRVPAGEFWLKSPARAAYEGVVFDPSGPAVLTGNRLNLWRGFSILPERGRWAKVEDHIYNILANGDQRAGDYIVKWKAWMYQNLGVPPGSALVFQGDEGVGKAIITKVDMKALGHCAMPIADREQFVGTFNGHLQHCVFVFLDEVVGFKDKKAEGILKTWLTEKTVTIRALYTQAFQARNSLHVNMASNNDWAVPAGPTARRFSVFGVSGKRRKDDDYFSGIAEEIDNGGAEAMLYDLLRMDLRGFHPGRIYETAALTKQKQRSLWGVDAAIETWLQKGALPGAWPKYPNRAFSEELWKDAMKHEACSEMQVLQRCQEIFGKENLQPKSTGARRGWMFPPLRQCREFWETKYGGSWLWLQDLPNWEADSKTYSLE